MIHNFVLKLLVLLLIEAVQRSSTSDDTQCIIVPSGSTSYVSAYMGQYLTGEGCRSNDIGKSYREVHVVMLQALSQGQQVLTLNVQLANQSDVSSLRFMLVVSAPHGVKIRVTAPIELEGSSPQGHKNTIVLSTGCDLQSSSLDLKRKNRSLPRQEADLLAWVRRKYKAVTSYTYLPTADEITVKLAGRAGNQQDCSNAHAMTIPQAGVHYEAQATRGCIQPNNAGSELVVGMPAFDLHVVEVLNSGTGGAVDVFVLGQGDQEVQLHLVLASPDPDLTFTVQVHDATGRLLIISDRAVSVGSVDQLESVQVSIIKFSGNSGASLITYLQQDHQGSPLSYTQVSYADRVVLRATSMITLDTDGMEISCDGGRFEISLPLDEPGQPDKQSLSWLDTSCHSYWNNSHNVLSTDVTKCGTETELKENSLVYKNTIVRGAASLPVACTVSLPSFSSDIFADSSFTEHLVLPVTIETETRLYVSLRTSSSTQSDLSLDMLNCHLATAMGTINLVENRCAREEAFFKFRGGFDFLSPAGQPYRRFSLKFPRDINWAYLVCEVGTCQGDCMKTCSPVRPKDVHVMRVGPILSRQTTGAGAGAGAAQHVNSPAEVRVEGLQPVTVVGVCLAAFILGVILVASLWIIHSKTKRRQTKPPATVDA